MLANVFELLFGCKHEHCSFPITAKKNSIKISAAADVTGTYVVCLDCGKEFPYDWQAMKVLSSSTKINPHRHLSATTTGDLSRVA